MTKVKITILIITFIISFTYYFFPIIRDYITNDIYRFQDYHIFWWPITLYQSLQVIAHKTIMPIVIQLLAAIITWLLLFISFYLIICGLKRENNS